MASSIWDDFDAADKSGGIWKEFDKTTPTDYLKSAASGVLSGTGMIAQGGGELAARGINAVAGTELRSENPFKGAIEWLEQSKSPGAHQAEAATQISGSLFDPSTWDFGTDPSVKGLALQGLNAIGQFAPNLGIALLTAGASVPAQLAIGATVGGIQALGGAAEEERTKFEAMGHDELMASSKLYQDLIQRGVPQNMAKQAVAEAAALGGGLGNAIPSAAEGAFENFLVGALTRGRIRIPGGNLATKVGVGVAGGGAMGGTEEAIEQMGQNVGSNIAVLGDRPVTADTLQQFVLGAIAEGAAGGGGAVAQHVLPPQTEEQRTGRAVRDINQAPTVDDAIRTAAQAAAEPVYMSDIIDSVFSPTDELGGVIQRAQRAAREEPAYQQAEAGKEADLDRMERERAQRVQGIETEQQRLAREEQERISRDRLANKVAGAEGEGAMAQALRRAAGVQDPDWGSIILSRMEALQGAGGASQPAAEPVASQAHAAGQAIPATGGQETTQEQPAPAAAATPTVVDQRAHEAAPSPQNALPEPTEAQKEAGNYRKGHARVAGLDISVENPAGSKRRPEWPDLQDHYGYIRGVAARAPDKEHVDVFLKPGTPDNFAGNVYVVDQKKKDGRFDEPKVMIGFGSLEEARAGYLRNYTPGWDGIMGVTPMGMAEFKAKLQDPAAFMKPQPAAAQPPSVRRQLYVERGGQRFPVASLEDARRKWDKFRNTTGAGASQIGEGARIVDQAGAEVARISYNGKVWPPGEWHDGMKPLIGEPFKAMSLPEINRSRVEAGVEPLSEAEFNRKPALTSSTPKPAAAQFGAKNSIFTADKAARARELLKKKLGQVSANAPLDPELIQAGIDLAGYYIEGGARSFAAYSAKMLADLGDAVKPYLKSWYLAVRNYPGFDRTGMNSEADIERAEAGEHQAAPAPKVEEKQSAPPGEQKPPAEDLQHPLQALKRVVSRVKDQDEKAAAQTDQQRPKDGDGKPIYEKGERVEVTGGPFKGRHGVISERNGITTTVLGLSRQAGFHGESSRTSYHYSIRTDNGAEGFVYPGEFKTEAGPNLTNVVEDIKIDGRYSTPEEVLRKVGYAKNSASNMRAKATRSVKASNKAEHIRNAELEEKKARQFQAAYDVWAERNPSDAQQVQKDKPAAPAPKATTPASSSASGMTLHESKHTKTGEKLWVVSLDKRVERDEYNVLNAKAKGLDGYYSSYRGNGAIPGFTFRDEAKAREFMGGEQPAEKAQPELAPVDDATEQALQERGEQVASRIDAERRWSAGERIFVLHEGADGPLEVKRYQDLSAYTADQMTALPADEGEEKAKPPAEPAAGTPAAVAKALRDAAQTIEAAATPVEAKPAEGDNGGDRERDLQADRPRGAEKQGAAAAREPEGERGARAVRGPEGGGRERSGGPRAVEVNRPEEGVVRNGLPGEGPGPDGNRPAGEGAGPERARLPAVAGENYRIEPADLTYEGSWKTKAAANVEAIRIAKAIAQEGRAATPEEQKKLVRFIGWGASEIANGIFPDKYGDYKPGWQQLGEQLRALLTDEEYDAAKRTTQYAHYTSRQVIESIHGALERMGFTGGRAIEPGMGIGLFAGLMPDTMARATKYTGIEYDPVPALIAKALFPKHNIIQGDYTKVELPDNFFDVAMGNPPFSGQVRVVNDGRYRKYNFALHDYFFAKTLDKVRPGGLVVFVTSAGTMNKASDRARQFMAERANLLGAIRLPQTAFMKNAGTEVVTDVLFLQKKGEGVQDYGQKWMELKDVPAKDGETASVNEYFAEHPEMVLGEHAMTGKMYGSNKNYNVEAREGENIEDAFRLAADRLPAAVYQPLKGSKEERAKVDLTDYSPTVQKEGNYYVKDGTLFQRVMGIGQPAEASAAAEKVIRDFIGLRDALKQAHYDQLSDGPWEQSLKGLQKAYRAFVGKHGRVNQFKTYERVDKEGKKHEWRRYPLHNIIDDDPDWTLVAALETEDEDTHKIHDSQFLSERVLNKPQPPKIETVQDAMYVQLDQDGALDLDRIAELSGTTKAQAVEVLGDAIFEAPNGTWQTADEYLSGNVGLKLKEARAAAGVEKRFARNIPALEKALPKPVPPSEIQARLGAPFIKPAHIEQFFREKLGLGVSVDYHAGQNLWNVVPTQGRGTVVADSDWGTDKRDAFELLSTALNKHQIRITYKDGEGKTHFDATATAAANDKLKKIKDAFSGWIWTDGNRAGAIAEDYNERFNNISPRQFDGSHLTLPGLSSKIRLRPHQKRVVWRIIQRGNTYIAHAVGAGKTLEMVVAGMEMRRLGMVKKPQYVVPNHMLQQFAREFMQAYPTAKLLVADEKEFHTDNRRRFVAKASLSDLDAIIITQSAFKLVDTKPEFKSKLIEEMIAEMQAAMEGLGDRDPSRKQLERNIETLEKRLEGDLSGERRDKNVYFEDMGVDFLFVDEAHLYRKLPFVTNQGNIKGIDPNGSQYALDLYVKTRWLEEEHPGRNLVMASGTPITNTVGELYTVQRYMAEKVLEERGLRQFDAWASMFGEERTGLEQNAAGHYAPVTRFAKFINVPELSQMFRDFADVIVGRDLGDLVPRPKLKTGARQMTIAPATPIVKEFQQQLAARMQAIENRKGPPKKGDDILLSVINDGRLLAIDPRFVVPGAQQHEQSKFNMMLDKAIELSKQTADWEFQDENGKTETVKGATQVIFSDLGFGDQVAASRGFDARGWLVKRLVAAGIPPQQIAFMSDYHKSADKLKLFQAVNAGRVRIVIGSSKNMGVGTNIQKRLYAEHHLDAPWYPADMEQREGRILRQGNKNPEVEIHTYATKGTYDSTMFQMNATKARFIEQMMTGDSTLRTMDDVSEASQYEMAQAISSGDERVIRLAGLKAELEGLNRLFAGFIDDQNALRRRMQDADWTIGNQGRRIPLIKADINTASAYLESSKFDATIAGKHFEKPGEAGDAIFRELKARGDKLEDGKDKLGTIGGFEVQFHGIMERDKKGAPKAYSAFASLVMQSGDTTMADYNTMVDASSVGAVMKATNAIHALPRELTNAEAQMNEAQARKKAAESRMGGQFEYLQKMEDVTKEIASIEDALKAESAAAKAAAQPTETPAPANPGESIAGDEPEFPEASGESDDYQASRPRTVYAQDEKGAPLLDVGKFQLVEPKRLDSAFAFEGGTPWQYKIVAGERVIGVATLNWKDGKVKDLMYVRTLEKFRGLGIAEDVVHGILVHNDGTPLRALAILPKARGFWAKMGTEFVKDAHGDEDGILTLENYLEAKADRDAEKTGGSGPGAGRGQADVGEGQERPSRPSVQGRGQALERVRSELVAAYGERGIRSLEKSGFLELTTSTDARLAPIADRMGGTEDAFLWKGKAWLLTDRMAPDAAPNRLLHELGEHHGLKDMLGAPAYGRLLKRVETMKKAGNQAVRDAWAHVAGAYPELEEGSEKFIGEVMAALSEDARVTRASWWRELLDTIRAWLVKMGLDVKSEEDIVTLLRASLRQVMRQAGEAVAVGEAEPAFARGATPSKYTGKLWHGKPLEKLTEREFRNAYVVHFDLREGADSRIESMRGGLKHGMATPDVIVDRNFNDGEGWVYPMRAPIRGWAQSHGVNVKGAIAYVYRGEDMEPDSAWLKEGAIPLAVVRLSENGQSVWQAIQAGGIIQPTNDVASEEFKRWFGGSKIVDKDGQPLKVYRGEHGAGATGKLQSRRGSLSFGSLDAAETYAAVPNDHEDNADHPRIYPAYLRITKPVINTPDEPFIDFKQIADAIGKEKALTIARELENEATNTNRWMDELRQEYDTPLEFLQKNPVSKWNELYMDAYHVFDRPQYVDWFKAAGYDGAIHGGNGDTAHDVEYKVFDADQVRSVFAPEVQFSRPAIAGTATTGDYRDSLTAGAASFVRDMLRSDATFNLWHKTFGTQQHKAIINREFRGVYDESQAFLSDVSKFANEAADLAASLLPRIEGFADFGKKSPGKADIAAVTRTLYAGTLFGGGSPMDGRKWTDDELRTGRAQDRRNGVSIPVFEPLTEPQIELYQQTLASVAKSLDELGKSLIHRLARQHDIGFDRNLPIADVARAVREQADERLGELRLQLSVARDRKDDAAIEKIGQAMEAMQDLKRGVADITKKTIDLQEHGYFPAMRFGRYAVHVVEPDGDGGYDQVHFSLHESQTAANLAARRLERELRPEHPRMEIERGIMSQEQYRLFQGISLDALETFADYITGQDGQPIGKDPLVQGFLKAAVAERSALKRHIHRKGTAGYSDDLPRVLASFTVSTARAASTSYHMAEMLSRAQAIRAGDVKDEAIKLVTYLRDPQEEAQGLRGFLFAQFLGGSIAHGLVNMTQPFMVTVPYLSQYTSAVDAAAKVTAAAGAKEAGLTGALRDAFERAKKEGVVAPQEIHQLRAETGGMPLGKSLMLRKLSFLWGSIYAVTEQFNRSTSFIAAYRVAESKRLEDPYTFAKKAVEETQFVYNKANRPNWARGPVGATVFTFKQFSISYLELAKRLYGRDKVAFAFMALMLLAAAGIEGLPFAEDIEDMIDTIGQWMGFATNSKKALRKWAERIVGRDVAPVALHGISGLPWMPVDVSVRMGMQNLIPGTSMLKLSEKNKARDVLEFVGPAGQFVPTEDTRSGARSSASRTATTSAP
jgi:N12 class adenine-specific DNA methylase